MKKLYIIKYFSYNIEIKRKLRLGRKINKNQKDLDLKEWNYKNRKLNQKLLVKII